MGGFPHKSQCLVKSSPHDACLCVCVCVGRRFLIEILGQTPVTNINIVLTTWLLSNRLQLDHFAFRTYLKKNGRRSIHPIPWFQYLKTRETRVTSEFASKKCHPSVPRCENGLLQKLWLRMTQMTGSRILSVYYKQTGCRRPRAVVLALSLAECWKTAGSGKRFCRPWLSPQNSYREVLRVQSWQAHSLI